MAQHAVEKVEKHDFGRTGRMALYGGGTSCATPGTSIPSDNSHGSWLIYTPTLNSGLRPCSNDMVWFPPTPHQPPIPKPHHPCSCLDRSDGFRIRKSFLLLEQYGDYGGIRPAEEAGKYIL